MADLEALSLEHLAGHRGDDQIGVGLETLICFFFQAEDGIRAYKVTGVQTCALPISWCSRAWVCTACWHTPWHSGPGRSEERRVGKSVDLGGRRIIKKKKTKRVD